MSDLNDGVKEYGARHMARHLFEAKNYERLLALADNRMERIAELERHNELLRDVAVQTGYAKGLRGMTNGMSTALQAAIDGGALGKDGEK